MIYQVKPRHIAQVLVVLSVLTSSVAVRAQQVSPTAPSAESGGFALEEIVVTAQKREERAQDTPLALTAVSAATLQDSRIETTEDFQFVAPALVYSDIAGFAEPYLRGIGSDFTQPNADAAVATYIDGAYIATDQATIQNLLGVERVEVLEGPQGTLYGRNALGGAINITTLTPSQEFQARTSVTYGDYQRKDADGYISGPLTNTLAVGLYVGETSTNPYVLAATQPVPPLTVNTDLGWGWRAKAVYVPIESVKLTMSVEETYSSTYDSTALRQISPFNPAHTLFGAPYLNQNYVAYGDGPSFAQITQRAGTLREEVDLGWAKILGITNGRHVRSYASDDDDGSSAPVIQAYQRPFRSDQWSQEAQLLSPDSSQWKWIAGLYYFHEFAGFDPTITYSPALFAPNDATAIYGSVDTDSYAAFGQTDIPMDRWVKNLTLTLGSRYTLDTKHFTGQTAVYGAGAVAACGGSPYGLDPSCAGPTGTTTQYPQQSAHWYNFSPKVTLSYKVADALLYATFSKGYASGVYNVTSPSNPGPAAPETLTDYELGVKSEWFDGRLRVNASAYLYSFQNLQVEVVNFGAEGSTTTLQNAANARAYGFENNLDFAITRELRISTAVNLEHTEYTSFPSFSGVNLALPCTGPANCNPTAALDVTGNQLTHAPEVVLSGGVVYDHDLGGDRGGVHGSLHWYHNGGFWWTAQNGLDGGVRQTAYNVANANAAYTFPGNQWTITAWVSNLTNQYYRSAVLPLSFLGVVAVDAPPRMFGATVTYKTK